MPTTSFLHTKQKIHLQVEEWVPFEFRGVSVQLYDTGVDGLFFDVPIDTGIVMKVRQEDFLKLRKLTASETAQAFFARLQKAGRKEREPLPVQNITDKYDDLVVDVEFMRLHDVEQGGELVLYVHLSIDLIMSKPEQPEQWSIRWDHFLDYLQNELKSYLDHFCPYAEEVWAASKKLKDDNGEPYFKEYPLTKGCLSTLDSLYRGEKHRLEERAAGKPVDLFGYFGGQDLYALEANGLIELKENGDADITPKGRELAKTLVR